MTSTIIYHNPQCSKSRQALDILQAHQLNPKIILYLEQGNLSIEIIAELLHQMNCQPRNIMRTKEAIYREKQLDNPALTHQELIQAIVNHPKLLQRPIVIHDSKTIIARPPQKIIDELV